MGIVFDLMKGIPDKSIDLILCDLPYGTTACKWDSIIPFEPLWEQYNRVIKDNGAIVLFSAQPFTTKLINSNYDYTYGGYSAPGNKAGKYLKDSSNDPAIAFTIASTKGYNSITYLGCFDGINHLYVNWNNTATN